MLLCNLGVSEYLCNVMRLIVTYLCNNIINAKVFTGVQFVREVHIYISLRSLLIRQKDTSDVPMKWHLFPVRAACTVTEHKL